MANAVKGKRMNNTEIKDVPYIAFESELARLERIIKRLSVIVFSLLIVLFATNLAWLYVWNQYDYETVEAQEIQAEQDGKGVNIIGGQDVNYGANGKNNKTQNTQTKKEKR